LCQQIKMKAMYWHSIVSCLSACGLKNDSATVN
jgi:hypothetical protein